jgi:hypothetical protein
MVNYKLYSRKKIKRTLWYSLDQGLVNECTELSLPTVLLYGLIRMKEVFSCIRGSKTPPWFM